MSFPCLQFSPIIAGYRPFTLKAVFRFHAARDDSCLLEPGSRCRPPGPSYGQPSEPDKKVRPRNPPKRHVRIDSADVASDCPFVLACETLFSQICKQSDWVVLGATALPRNSLGSVGHGRFQATDGVLEAILVLDLRSDCGEMLFKKIFCVSNSLISAASVESRERAG